MPQGKVRAVNSAKQGWKQNPEAVKRDIISVAVAEFAARGLSGARVDTIAAKTQTSKRMIYYYFGDKEGLYARALEAAYAEVRYGEEALELDSLPAVDALAKLVAFSFDHHRAHPEFVRMVMIENIHDAGFIDRSEVIRRLNMSAILQLRAICTRGERDGSFRVGLDPIRLHWLISALSFFNVSNRPTFSALYGSDLFAEAAQDELRDEIVRIVLGTVRPIG